MVSKMCLCVRLSLPTAYYTLWPFIVFYVPKWLWAEMVMGRNGYEPKWPMTFNRFVEIPEHTKTPEHTNNQ